MKLEVLGRGEKAPRGFRVVDRAAAAVVGTARLRLSPLDLGRRGPDGLRRRSRVRQALAVLAAVGAIVARAQLVAQNAGLVARGLAHCRAPLRICAIWMNRMGEPSRSAQPFWCIKQDVSAETM